MKTALKTDSRRPRPAALYLLSLAAALVGAVAALTTTPLQTLAVLT